MWSLLSDVIAESAGDRPIIRRGPPYPHWPNDRQHYEYHGVPFRGRGGMGYMSRGGGWFARRGSGAEMGRGMRRRPIINRSRSRSRSRSSRSRSRSRTRSSSRSRSPESGSHGRKRGVSASCIVYLTIVCGAGAPLFPPCPFTSSSFPLLLFPFFHWLYLLSSFVHPFPFYQNSPTPFPGWRS